MVYFDNAATSFPKPSAVIQAQQFAVTKLGGNPGRGGHRFSIAAGERVFSVREKAAEMFHTDPERVIFTANCTEALNFAIKGLLKRGGHVLCSELEHNAVFRPLWKAQEEGLIELEIVPVFEQEPWRTVEAFARRIRPQTCLVACTHASNVSGHILPVEEIGALCKRTGVCFVVDAAQTAGHIPIDIEKLGADAVCVAAHKGLYAPSGTGMLLLSKNAPFFDTLIEGGTGSVSAQEAMPDFLPDRLEVGSINTSGILGIGAGIDFVRENQARFASHEHALCDYVERELQKIPGVHILEHGKKHVPVLSFWTDDFHSEEITAYLDRSGFALRGGLHCAPLAHRHYGTERQGTVRFSPSCFNTKSQCVQFVAAMRNIRKNMNRKLELPLQNC